MSLTPMAPLSSKEPIDVLIIGFGAVGCMYGWILSQNANVRVTAIARSSYDAMSKGIKIDSEKFGLIEGWKPYRLVRTAEEANDRPYAFIVGTFKCVPDLLPSASVFSAFVEGPHGVKDGNTGPTLVLIQNGIGIEHPVQLTYPNTPIISVVAWIGANVHEKGAVVTHGMLEKLVMGLYKGEGINSAANPLTRDEPVTDIFGDPAGYRHTVDGERRLHYGTQKTHEFAALINGGGGVAEVVEDIQPKRYMKNIWNASWSSLCTMARAPVSALVAPALLPSTLPVIRRIALEVVYIAREWGYAEDVLPLKSIDDAIKITIQNYQVKTEAQTPATPGLRADAFGGYGFSFPPQGPEQPGAPASTAEFKPSMLLDVEAGRPCELEPIIGALLDRARAKGVETPRLDMAYAALKVYQEAAVRKAAECQDHQRHTAAWFLRKPAVAGAGGDGRKEWEKAVRASERAEQVAKVMNAGSGKVLGKPIRTDTGDLESVV